MLYAPSVVAVGRSLIIKGLSLNSFALICFIDSHVFTLPMLFFYPGISKGSWDLSVMTSPIPPLPAGHQAGRGGLAAALVRPHRRDSGEGISHGTMPTPAVPASLAAVLQLALTPTAKPPLSFRSLSSPLHPQLAYIVVTARVIPSR